MKKIVRIISKGQVVNVTKSDGTTIQKCTVQMQELGGQYEDSYAAAALGPMAQLQLNPGDLCAVSVRFQAHEYNGQVFQDVLLQDCCKIA